MAPLTWCWTLFYGILMLLTIKSRFLVNFQFVAGQFSCGIIYENVKYYVFTTFPMSVQFHIVSWYDLIANSMYIS